MSERQRLLLLTERDWSDATRAQVRTFLARPPLLPDDDTAVERLAAALRLVPNGPFDDHLHGASAGLLASAIIAALREGGQPE